MKEITEITEIQNLAYDLLKQFADFCDTHELRYVLAGGTLLGAVRHHDFIPWDDDVDVLMPRPDYQRFLELTSTGIGANTAVCYFKNTPNMYGAYAKLIDTRTVMYEDVIKPPALGAFIDIFPTDGLPDDEGKIKQHFRKLSFYKDVLAASMQKIQKGKSWKAFFIKMLLFPTARVCVNRQKTIEKIDRLAQKYPLDTSHQIAFQVLGYRLKEITNKEEFLTRVKMQFRDKEFWIPSNYRAYLTQLFGDYMKLPPVEKRISTHTYKLYWKDDKENKK